MRTLRFIVDGQIIKQDPNCNFEGLVPGSEGYLAAEFILSPEWHGCDIVAGFYSNLGKEYPPQVLTTNNKCFIPAEALEKRVFKVRLFGKNGAVRLITNKVAVRQNGGNK